MSVFDFITTEIQSRSAAFIAGFGMSGGSVTAFVGWLGSQDIVAGVGALVAVGSLIGSQIHRRAERRNNERDRLARRNIAIAKLSPTERETYLKLEASSREL